MALAAEAFTPDEFAANVDFFGVSLGAGVLVKDRINLDFAYVYRFGDGAREDTFGLYGTDADVDQHTLYMSTVIYF